MAGLQFSSGIDKGFETDLKRLNKRMNEFEGKTVKSSDKIDKSFGNIANTVKNLAAFGGFAAIGVELKQLTDDTYKYRNELAKLTDLQGENLNDFTANMQASASTFGQEVGEMNIAVSNFAKGMKLDFNEALTIVDKGFVDGANGSKEFLDTLKEYSPLMKEAGVDGQQFVDIITQSAKQGIYSDKGIDTIKEGNLRLREMTKATSKAIDAIGLSSVELQKGLRDGSITTFDAIQQVSNKLAELPASSAKVGTAIADIFGGPGEDAGIEFITMLGTVNSEFEKVETNLSETQKQEVELLKVNKELQKAFSDLLPDKNPLTEISISAKEALVFLIENKDIVLSLIGAFAGWKAGMIATNAVIKINTLLTAQQAKAQKMSALTGKKVTAANMLMTKSFKSLKVAIATNPIGLLVTAISLALPWILDFASDTDEATKSQSGLNDELQKGVDLTNQYAEAKKKQGVASKLSASALKEHKQNLEALIESQEASLLLSEEESKQSKTTGTVDIGGGISLPKASGRDLALGVNTAQRKKQIEDLKKDLAETEKLISELPKEIQKKNEKSQKDAQKAALKNIEITNQERSNEIQKQHISELGAQEELNQKLLENDLKYLQEKRKLTTDELEKLKIDEQIIQNRAAITPLVDASSKVGSVSSKKAPISESDTFKNEIASLEKRIYKVKIANDSNNKSFSESVQIFNEVDSIMGALVDSFDGVDSTVSTILQGTAGVAQGLVGMANGIIATKNAMTGLEKASGILAVISAAIKLSDAISGAFDKVREQRSEAHVRELKQIHEVNAQLINQIALYKDGNELLSDDKWGTALAGLDAYNKALEFQGNILTNLSTQGTQAESTLGGDVLKTIVDPLSGPLSILGGRNERKQLESIREQAQNYGTELEKALAGIAIKTDEAGKVTSFFGASDKYGSLLKLYPDLINANGALNTELLNTVVSTEDLADVDRERLTQLIELTDQAEEAYANFGNYIADIFGGVGDEVAQAFQTMYETGDDAMSSLEGSMSDMIEAFTRDIVEFSLLQPLVNQVNEAAQGLGEQYAKGDLSAEELQSGIVDQLGSFYNSLGEIQPQILQAYENADKLAESAGFGAAFSGDTGTVAASSSSAAAQIKRDITEGTASEMVGRLNALMISNQGIYENSFEMLDLGVANLAALNKIVVNTDYLPEIASNTKKTYEKLSNL